MCAGLARIAAEDAVATIILAKVGKGNEDLARVGNDRRFEAFFQFFGLVKQPG